MKTYRGDMGPPPTIRVDDGATERVLIESPDLAWGKTAPDEARRTIAMLLLFDALGDMRQAHTYHQRFKYRTVVTWREGQPWEINEAEIRGHVDDMKAVESSATTMRRQIEREPAPIVNEGGQGIGWTKQGKSAS
jgi:hypothetical protein